MDQLRPAKTKGVIGRFQRDIVPHVSQGSDCIRVHRCFAGHTQRLSHAPSWRVRRHLRVLSEKLRAQNHLDMALRLHGAAHHTETHQGIFWTHQETWDDGVKGPFVWSDTILMGRVQRKPGAAEALRVQKLVEMMLAGTG